MPKCTPIYRQVTWLVVTEVQSNTSCCDTFLVSHAFSALCMYSKFGHHPHPLGYRPAKSHTHSLTQSPSLFDCAGKKYTIIITIINTPPQYGIAVLQSMCLSVFSWAYLWHHWTDLHGVFVQISCGRGSVLLLRHCDKLCTSGFIDDIMFGRRGSYGDACLPVVALRYQNRVWCLWMPRSSTLHYNSHLVYAKIRDKIAQ